MARTECQMNYAVVSMGICPTNYLKYVLKAESCYCFVEKYISGINILTQPFQILYIYTMNKKHENLRKAGLFNPNFQKIKDTRFSQESSFFDPCDNLQVRYEMIRSHIIEGDNVSKVCKQFGVTRQTFYNLQEKFSIEGSSGLLQKKPGPHGPSKLNKTVMNFIKDRIANHEKISAIQLTREITQKFDISLHRRTVEKILKGLHKKKHQN